MKFYSLILITEVPVSSLSLQAMHEGYRGISEQAILI